MKRQQNSTKIAKHINRFDEKILIMNDKFLVLLETLKTKVSITLSDFYLFVL